MLSRIAGAQQRVERPGNDRPSTRASATRVACGRDSSSTSPASRTRRCRRARRARAPRAQSPQRARSSPLAGASSNTTVGSASSALHREPRPPPDPRRRRCGGRHALEACRRERRVDGSRGVPARCATRTPARGRMRPRGNPSRSSTTADAAARRRTAQRSHARALAGLAASLVLPGRRSGPGTRTRCRPGDRTNTTPRRPDPRSRPWTRCVAGRSTSVPRRPDVLDHAVRALKRRNRAAARFLINAPARNRTWNLRIKSPLLCQLSYKGAARKG